VNFFYFIGFTFQCILPTSHVAAWLFTAAIRRDATAQLQRWAGAIYNTGRSCFVDGGDYSDGPANFSTSQNPPGGDGPRGAILFRDTGSATWQLPSQESVPSNWLLRLHGADCGLQFL